MSTFSPECSRHAKKPSKQKPVPEPERIAKLGIGLLFRNDETGEVKHLLDIEGGLEITHAEIRGEVQKALIGKRI